jgi:hypothetical protein
VKLGSEQVMMTVSGGSETWNCFELGPCVLLDGFLQKTILRSLVIEKAKVRQ